MLGQAVLQGMSLEDYVNPRHPVQQHILKTFAEMCDVDPESILIGIDGCSAPVFAVPLYKAALGYARLCGPEHLSPERAKACRKITHAMTVYPEMVAGPERFDTVLMEAGEGKIIAKGGAEGYQAIGLLEGACSAGSKALGIAIKISDGDASGRARTVVSLEILRQLGALSKQQEERLSIFDRRAIHNHRGLTIGEIRPCFKIAS